MQPHRRRTEFIDPEVQGALAKRIAVHWMLYVGVATLLVVGLKWMTSPFTPLWDHVVDAWWTYGAMLIVMLCLAPVFVYDAVKLSNRFTGPMLRLRTSLRELAEGERPTPIKLRDGDFWQEAADDFNRAVDRLLPGEESGDRPA
ncbi:MAG: hypothetical protein AAF805_08655 [Planctomycetota bacterium]